MFDINGDSKDLDLNAGTMQRPLSVTRELLPRDGSESARRSNAGCSPRERADPGTADCAGRGRACDEEPSSTSRASRSWDGRLRGGGGGATLSVLICGRADLGTAAPRRGESTRASTIIETGSEAAPFGCYGRSGGRAPFGCYGRSGGPALPSAATAGPGGGLPSAAAAGPGGQRSLRLLRQDRGAGSLRLLRQVRGATPFDYHGRIGGLESPLTDASLCRGGTPTTGNVGHLPGGGGARIKCG
jgi:hypothetical protein